MCSASSALHVDSLVTSGQQMAAHTWLVKVEMETRRLPAPKCCPSPTDTAYSHLKYAHRDKTRLNMIIYSALIVNFLVNQRQIYIYIYLEYDDIGRQYIIPTSLSASVVNTVLFNSGICWTSCQGLNASQVQNNIFHHYPMYSIILTKS